MTAPPELELWLQDFITKHEGAAGTVRFFETGGLRLASAINIPPRVQQAVAWAPTGNVNPGAKAVNARAAVALPVGDGAAAIRAVVGIAFPHERKFTTDELANLTAVASTVPSS